MKNRYFTRGFEAVQSKPGDERFIVRPVHPDGAGYAAISHPIDKDLAQLWAFVGNLSRNDWELIAAGLELLQPDSDKVRQRALELEAWARVRGWEPGE